MPPAGGDEKQPRPRRLDVRQHRIYEASSKPGFAIDWGAQSRHLQVNTTAGAMAVYQAV